MSCAARTDDVAHVPLLELARTATRGDSIAANHELDLTRAVLQLHEAAAAHHALRHHAAGDAHGRSDRCDSDSAQCDLIASRAARRRARRAGSRSGMRRRTRASRASFARRSAIKRFSLARRLARRRSCLLQSLLQAFLQKLVEIAVEHRTAAGRSRGWCANPSRATDRARRSESGCPSRCRLCCPRRSAPARCASAPRARTASLASDSSRSRGSCAASARSGTARRCRSGCA